LLATIPTGVDAPLSIEDRYLDGTRLRLRAMGRDDQVVYKLTQKVPLRPEVSALSITSMYLSREEYEALRWLPGRDLRKTRRPWQVGAHRFAVDEYQARLAGLLVAEIELGADEDLTPTVLAELPLGPEVTGDERYTGGRLAHASDPDLDVLFGERRCGFSD
jgi:CYTH domain-containing protein